MQFTSAESRFKMPSMNEKLPRKFYTRHATVQIAKDLIGCLLVVPTVDGRRVSGMIVETEAYLGAIDKAAHSYKNRRTKRTETMFSIGGTVYVFFVYGMYFQFNVVVGQQNTPHAILIRAVEPIDGIEVMRERRGKAMNDKNLTSGPGKLCIALGVDKTFDGADLLSEKVWLEKFRKFSEAEIASGKRIGIDYAEEFTEKLWRFWLKGNDFVSRK
jgi:DNA-3-methyladenine glycosylase